jgi:hypothetical protein
MEFDSLVEALKLGLAVATLGGIAALRTFVRKISEETTRPLARDIVLIRDQHDELRTDFDEHIKEHHHD